MYQLSPALRQQNERRRKAVCDMTRDLGSVSTLDQESWKKKEKKKKKKKEKKKKKKPWTDHWVGQQL